MTAIAWLSLTSMASAGLVLHSLLRASRRAVDPRLKAFEDDEQMHAVRSRPGSNQRTRRGPDLTAH